ncbi:MAG: hypothetical protein ABL958_17825 [Bdellovibrionia bacterium]
MSQAGVLLFRGLNTYGDDILHVGPMNFGESYRHWIKALRGAAVRNTWETLPVLTMGSGRMPDMVERSKQYLRNSPDWKDTDRKFHILAHSTGGVVARALVHDPEIQRRILSLTTVGAPHMGAAAGVRAEQVHPSVRSMLKTFGYDLEQRKVYFKDLLPDSMNAFNERYPNVAGIRYASILAEKPPAGPSLPMHFLEMSIGYFNEPSDGLIPVASQRWGEILGHVQMDHLELAGFCFHFKPAARRRFHSEWKRFFSLLEDYWLRVPATFL